jgi:hypothetical protein
MTESTPFRWSIFVNTWPTFWINYANFFFQILFCLKQRYVTKLSRELRLTDITSEVEGVYVRYAIFSIWGGVAPATNILWRLRINVVSQED